MNKSMVAALREWVAKLYQWLGRFEKSSDIDVILAPETHVEELQAFFRELDPPDEGARAYVKEHAARFVRTLSVTPPPRATSRVLELGAYMQMTPALQLVLGYREVRGGYFGRLGKTDRKTASVNGKQVFECYVDQFDAEKDIFPYPDSHFDAVLACEILEHFLHDPMHMLVECRRILAPEGALILTTPNIDSYTAVARVLEQGPNPQLYSQYADPRGEFAESEITHVREYTPQELKEVLECAGFEIDALFTEIPPNYHAHLWVKDFIARTHFPTSLRGEQMYCVAHRVENAAITRYPDFLYALS